MIRGQAVAAPGPVDCVLSRRRARSVLARSFAALLPLASLPALAADLPAGFVYLSEADASIRQDVRYAGRYNFLGRAAKAYDAPQCILTEQAAAALSAAQSKLAGQNLTLVVFDCYRPVSAVQDFVAWTTQGRGTDPRWHPKVKRSQLIAKGYIGRRSAHSRGSTVDVALAPLDRALAAPDPECGAAGTATIDFGTGFDCFDPKTRTAAKGLSAQAESNREKLVALMLAAGFRNYAGEWWHFTLREEPFQNKSFDFPVTAP